MWQLLVLYNGNWVDILPKSNNLNWSSNSDNLAIELNFESMYNIPDDSLVSLMKDGREIIRTVAGRGSEKTFTYSYTCFDYMWYFNKNKELIQFNGVSATKAIEQLSSKVDVKCSIASMNTVIKKIYKQEISSIIDDILDQVQKETGCKYIKYMDINIFTVAKLEDLKIYPKYIVSNDVVKNWDKDNMKNSIIVASNDDKNINIRAVAKDGSSIGKYGRLQEVIEVDEKDFSQASNLANNTLKELNKVTKDVTVSILVMEKGEEIKANRFIYMKVPERNLDGWYKIKSANHSVSRDIHKVSLMLEV